MLENSGYALRYLPLFYSDLEEKVLYIRDELENAAAAKDLIDDVEAAVMERLKAPEAFEIYHSKRNRHYPYYRIYLRNYTIYYVVISDEGPQKIMEVRRLLYNGQDRDRYL